MHTPRGRLTRALKPAACGAAALALLVGAAGAGAGPAGASARGKPKTVINFAKYVGGHGAASSKLAPVYIGVVNQRTSTAAIAPVFTTGAKLAQQFLNQHAHGIDGHPVRLVFCAIPTTVASATKCGQQFANDPRVSAVVAGAVDVGNTALESALGPSRKPIFFGVSLSTVDDKDSHGFILFGTGTSIAAPQATFAKKLHAKSVSITYPSNQPAEVEGANILYDALRYEGVKKVYKVGYTSADTNLTVPMEAAHVATSTLLIAYNSGGPVCSDTYLTLKSLGLTNKEVLTNGPCLTPTIAKADGGQLPLGWYYAQVFESASGASTPSVDTFQKIAKGYGMVAQSFNPWTMAAFGQMLTLARLETRVLKAHKKLTPATVTAAAKAFRGPVAMGAPTVHCGGFPATGPAVCTDVSRYYQNTAPTVLKLIGNWIGPPKGFKRP